MSIFIVVSLYISGLVIMRPFYYYTFAYGSHVSLSFMPITDERWNMKWLQRQWKCF